MRKSNNAVVRSAKITNIVSAGMMATSGVMVMIKIGRAHV